MTPTLDRSVSFAREHERFLTFPSEQWRLRARDVTQCLLWNDSFMARAGWCW